MGRRWPPWWRDIRIEYSFRLWREGRCIGHKIIEERTQTILLADTTPDALREQMPLSKSKSILESTNFNFDNLGPKKVPAAASIFPSPGVWRLARCGGGLFNLTL